MKIKALMRQFVPSPARLWLRRRINELRIRRRARLRRQHIAKHGTFTAQQLIAACREAGIKPGGVLFVHCSYNDLLTYQGTPYELLEGLRELVGPSGTLLMPAYTTNMQENPCRPFDVRCEPACTGIIPELLRREDGVVRSLHPRHSLCGLGPRAEELLSGHEDCICADGADSPFDRLRHMDAQALCLGLPPGFNSFVHWVEDIEPDKYPIRTHEGPYECILTDANGRQLSRPFYRRAPNQRKFESLVGRSLSPQSIKKLSLCGVSICIYYWPALAGELLALRDRGIVSFR